ncbi:MAG: NADP-dependent oxidoreductase [Polyangiales bacterium]
MSVGKQRRVVLAARPNGAPGPETFRIEEVPVPAIPPGGVLLRTLYLSLDPYMRGRLVEGPSYAKSVSLGETMLGGTLSRVEVSEHAELRVGDVVLSSAGWQEYVASDGAGLQRIDESFVRPTYALGVLGMPGFTAYHGLFEIGQPQPGETVVVAAATGAVGAVVGQLAKIAGARVVGIAGGADKCEYAVNELGFDVCLDRKQPDLAARLRAACPKGIDVYFENVGGAVFAAVAPLLNVHARVPICGFISRYNRGADYTNPGPDRTELLLAGVLFNRWRIQGFIISDHDAQKPAFLARMKPWVHSGQVKTREHIVRGLERAPEALAGLLEGNNFGKVLIQVSD